jgi:hypothetical protein
VRLFEQRAAVGTTADAGTNLLMGAVRARPWARRQALPCKETEGARLLTIAFALAGLGSCSPARRSRQRLLRRRRDGLGREGKRDRRPGPSASEPAPGADTLASPRNIMPMS